MHLLAVQSDLAQQLAGRLRQLNELIFLQLGDPDQVVNLQPGESLSTEQAGEHWCWLRDGAMRGLQHEQAVIEFEPGDMIGLAAGYGLPDLMHVAQAPSEMSLYQVDRVLKYLHETKKRAAQWTALLLTELSFARQGLLVEAAGDQGNTGFLQFSKGETIIREGDPAGEVYHMVQGHADVYRGGVVVGEVPPGELFGAMAMLCHTPRTATVVAREDVLVAAVPQEDFQSLIQQHPETAVTLMENMARAINDLNGRLQAYSREENAAGS